MERNLRIAVWSVGIVAFLSLMAMVLLPDIQPTLTIRIVAGALLLTSLAAAAALIYDSRPFSVGPHSRWRLTIPLLVALGVLFIVVLF